MYLALYLHGYFIFVSEFTLTHVDEFIDELLTKDYSCDTALPRIQKRFVFSSMSVCCALGNYFACGIFIGILI